MRLNQLILSTLQLGDHGIEGIYHLLHFTTREPSVNLTGKDFSGLAVYDMMVTGFRQPVVSLFYIVAVGLVCFHLSHGAGSWFQSLGLKNEAYQAAIDRLAKVIAWILFLGYSSIPVAILTGLVK